ncbi:hypothetical protein LRS40_21150 [Leclercia sp. G3L]|uniref:hypothetical protein n=1 Tax=Leclercia sp. G3L TaxID=2898725 RepID=UPI001E630A2C|nr:hypothetical protein [Leclercia sp. G3L]UGB02122.1 hypothetical protein LRS40_21150 [Leclercia sp. G3L]
MKQLPPNNFFTLKRASELLEIEEIDLLLMASDGAIYLSVFLDGFHSTLSSTKNDDGTIFGGDIKVSQFFIYDPIYYPETEHHHEGTDLVYNTGIASGPWHVLADVITSILRYGKSGLDRVLSSAYQDVKFDIDGRADYLVLESEFRYTVPSDCVDEKILRKQYELQDKLVVTKEDLYISRAWLLKVAEHINNGKALPKIFETLTGEFERRTEQKIIAHTKPHGNKARYSENRENCLMALIYTKKCYPDDCRNPNGSETNDAWANATRDHWHSVGGGYDEPSTDYLKKIISDMDRKPQDRTTAGKPKGSDTKN